MRALRRTHQPRSTPAMDAPWRRDLRLIALSRGITMAGAEAGYIALLALAWELTGSASRASIVMIAAVVAQMIGAPFAGWIGDRFDRRRVIIIGEIGIAVGLLALSQASTLPQLMVIFAIISLLGVTCGAALDAAMPNLVPRSELVRANATLGMVQTLGHLAGPVMGGIAVAAFGARSAFVFDAGTSLLSAVLVLAVRGATSQPAPGAASTRNDEQQGLLAGLRVIARDPILSLLTVGWAGMTVCFALATVAELPLAVQFGMDETGLGAMITAWCAGAFIGAWQARRARIDRHGAMVLIVNAAICCMVFIAVGLAPWFWLVLVLMSIGGASMAAAGIVQTTMIQARVPDAVRARVRATQLGINSAVWGANLALGGLMVEATSPAATYSLAGIWCLIAAVGFVGVARHVRHERHRELIWSLRGRAALETDLAVGG